MTPQNYEIMKNVSSIVLAILRRLFLEGCTNSGKINEFGKKCVTPDNWHHVNKLGIQ